MSLKAFIVMPLLNHQRYSHYNCSCKGVAVSKLSSLGIRLSDPPMLDIQMFVDQPLLQLIRLRPVVHINFITLYVVFVQSTTNYGLLKIFQTTKFWGLVYRLYVYTLIVLFLAQQSALTTAFPTKLYFWYSLSL